MTVFSLDVNTFGNINHITAQLGATEAQVQTAAMRTLNKTAIWLRAQSTKEISREKQLPQKLIRQRLQVIKARRSSLKALVVASLYGVKASKLGVMRQTAQGAKVGKYMFEKAFIATMRTGHRGVFKRKTQSRLPIQEVAIALEPVASNIIKGFVDSDAGNKFAHFLKHELNFILRAKP